MRRLVPAWIALVLLLLAADAALAGRPRYSDPNDLGPFGVGHFVVDLHDAARDRPLRVEIWYPVDLEDAVGEPTFYDFQFFGLGLTSPVAIEDADVTDSAWLPLVIFSHGSGGVSWQSTPLMEQLASHGMIVVAPNHTGNTVNDVLGDTQDPFEQVAVDRPKDVSFLIDHMLARSADPEDFFYARVDPNRIGVAGHSFGGYTAIVVASGLDNDAFGVHVEPDPRVRAVVPIAPASFPFSDAELAGIRIPMLLLSGSEDDTTPVDPNTTRPWEHVSGRPLYRADIEGAGHYHFANICDIAQALLDFGVTEEQVAFLIGDDYYTTCGAGAYPIAEARRLQNFYVAAFLKQQLWYDDRYAPFLTPEYAAENERDVLFSSKEGDQ
jgi:predicted dienelactone hydrolase